MIDSLTTLRPLLGLMPLAAMGMTIAAFSKSSEYPFEALIKGTLTWAWVLIIFSHIFSIFSALNTVSLFAFWLLYGGVALFWNVRNGVSLPAKPVVNWLIIAVSCLLLFTLAAALLYPPNTWDGLTYHMPKIVQWWESGNQSFYETHDIRQNALTPGAETIIFHSFILANGDYFANLVQWGAFSGSICVAYATASLLGTGKLGSLVAALFVATLPMAIAQASSTQTDMTVAFFLLCLANRFLVWLREQCASNAVFCGMALGLALCVKGTAYHLSLPFVVVFTFFAFFRFKKLFLQCALVAIIALPCFFPHLIRMHSMYGGLTDENSKYTLLASPSPKTFVALSSANILSNIPRFSRKYSFAPLFFQVLQILGVDKSDPFVFPYGGVEKRAQTPPYYVHEDTAHNPLHLVAMMLCLFLWVPRNRPGALLYKWCVIGGIFLFCLLLPWQPWITRLHVPLFVLMAPLVGMQAELRCRPRWMLTAAGVFIFFSIPALFWTQQRPLLPYPFKGSIPSENFWFNAEREKLYFNNNPKLRQPYIDIAERIVEMKPKQVFVFRGGDSCEYPLWALLNVHLNDMPQLRFISESTIQEMQDGVLLKDGNTIIFVTGRFLPGQLGEDPNMPQLYEYAKNTLQRVL